MSELEKTLRWSRNRSVLFQDGQILWEMLSAPRTAFGAPLPSHLDASLPLQPPTAFLPTITIYNTPVASGKNQTGSTPVYFKNLSQFSLLAIMPFSTYWDFLAICNSSVARPQKG